VLVASDDNGSPDTMVGLPISYAVPEDQQSPHIHTYRVTYRCKFCQHEWDDLTQAGFEEGRFSRYFLLSLDIPALPSLWPWQSDRSD
jgi:hypothetical protein